MEIKRSGSQRSSKGPADWFTGTMLIDSPFKGTDPARVAGAIVTFEPATAGQLAVLHVCNNADVIARL